MCLLIHFVLKMFMYLLETVNIMFLSFIRFDLLSFEHGNPISHNGFGTFFQKHVVLQLIHIYINSTC